MTLISDDLREGTWIIRKAFPRHPCQVIAIHPFPGVACGFLVEHNGAGISILDAASVCRCPPESVPASRHALPLKNEVKESKVIKRKQKVPPSGMNIFGILE
jgi:hypothetical protein